MNAGSEFSKETENARLIKLLKLDKAGIICWVKRFSHRSVHKLL
jgi:hypothetical protein